VWTFAKVDGKYGANDPGMRVTILKSVVVPKWSSCVNRVYFWTVWCCST
jgi:hypothetical protein